MKKLSAISIIICIIAVIAMTATATYAWFESGELADSTVLHQANSPQANVEIQDIVQTGDLSPAVPYVNSVGVPSYISDRTGFDAYVAEYTLLEADGTYIAKAAQAVQFTGKFKYEGKDDAGTDVGKRTLVVQLEAKNRTTQNNISTANFAYNFEADTDNDEGTPAEIVKANKDRVDYNKGGEIYYQVLTIQVDPAVATDDWYWFTMTIYFSNIDDHMDITLNGLPIDFTMNIIAA